MSMPEQDEAAQPQGLVEQLKAPLITSTSVPDEADELKQLVEQLTTAAKACDYSPGAKGYIARTNVAGIAKDIARLMMAPSDMSMHHSINVCTLRRNEGNHLLTGRRCRKSSAFGH